MNTENPEAPAPAAPAEPSVEERIDKIIVQAVKTVYVDGRPVKEDPSQPVVVFRAAVSDVWGFFDKAINGPREDHPAGA